MAPVESGRALERRDPRGESFSHWVIVMGTLLSFLLSFDTWLAFGPTYIFKEIIIGFLATAPKQYRQPTIDWNQLNYGPKWGFSLYKLITSCMWSSNKQPADTVPSLQGLLSVPVRLKRHATIRPCPAALLPISLLSHIKPAPGLLRLCSCQNVPSPFFSPCLFHRTFEVAEKSPRKYKIQMSPPLGNTCEALKLSTFVCSTLTCMFYRITQLWLSVFTCFLPLYWFWSS